METLLENLEIGKRKFGISNPPNDVYSLFMAYSFQFIPLIIYVIYKLNTMCMMFI